MQYPLVVRVTPDVVDSGYSVELGRLDSMSLCNAGVKLGAERWVGRLQQLGVGRPWLVLNQGSSYIREGDTSGNHATGWAFSARGPRLP